MGILFSLFGAPIKAVIDKYLGWVTTAFVLLVVGGFVVLTQFSSSDEDVAEKCDNATEVRA